ncbi:MAG: sulfotransferase [Aestuariibacter sp.]
MMSTEQQVIERELDVAVSAMRKKDLATAVAALTNVLHKHPKNPMALSLYGHCTLQQNRHDALNALKQAAELEPEHPQWNINYAQALLQTKQPALALSYFVKANQLLDDHPVTLAGIINSHMAMGEYQQALPYSQLLLKRGYSANHQRTYARLLYGLGQYSEAQKALSQQQHKPNWSDDDRLLMCQIAMQQLNYSDALSYLNSIQTAIHTSPLLTIEKAKLLLALGDVEQCKSTISELDEQFKMHPEVLSLAIDLGLESNFDAIPTVIENDSLSFYQRRTLAYSLSRALDKKGQYQQAWQACIRANQLYHHPVSFDLERYQHLFANALSLCKKPGNLSHRPMPFTPVFIIGAPRTGATLVQNTICASPESASLEERGALLPYLMNLLTDHDETQSTLPVEFLQQLRESDIAGLQAHVNSDTRFLVDKTPHHALVVGLLLKLYPNAVFIEVQRQKPDTALSILMNDFSEEFDYTRDFDSALKYLSWHDEAIQRWRDSGIVIHSIKYEDFVENPTAIAALFKAIGLDFSDEFLQTRTRLSSTKNFSAISARTDIHMSSVNKFQHYQAFIHK